MLGFSSHLPEVGQVPDHSSKIMIQYIMRLDDLCRINANITVLYGSSLDEKFSERISAWIAAKLTGETAICDTLL